MCVCVGSRKWSLASTEKSAGDGGVTEFLEKLVNGLSRNDSLEPRNGNSRTSLKNRLSEVREAQQVKIKKSYDFLFSVSVISGLILSLLCMYMCVCDHGWI